MISSFRVRSSFHSFRTLCSLLVVFSFYSTVPLSFLTAPLMTCESRRSSLGASRRRSLSLSEVTTHPPTAATQPPTRPAKSDGQWAFDRQVARFPVDCVLGLVCLNSRTSLTRGSRGEEAHTLSHTHPHTHTQKGKTPNVDNDRRRRCKGNKKNETSTND